MYATELAHSSRNLVLLWNLNKHEPRDFQDRWNDHQINQNDVTSDAEGLNAANPLRDGNTPGGNIRISTIVNRLAFKKETDNPDKKIVFNAGDNSRHGDVLNIMSAYQHGGEYHLLANDGISARVTLLSDESDAEYKKSMKALVRAAVFGGMSGIAYYCGQLYNACNS